MHQAGMEQQTDEGGVVDRDAFADIIDPRALVGAAGGDNAGIIEVRMLLRQLNTQWLRDPL
jgi:hypothetical protein